MLHAIVVTLVRIGVTHERLLEWETAAASAGGGVPRAGVFMKRMIASPLLAVGTLAGLAVIDPRAIPAALSLLLLWAAAPSVAFLLSRPVPARREAITEADRAFLQAVALRTWRYFDAFMGPGDHALPPDNVQMPDLRVAHRTSPTNIAMGLLATVSAHDLGFIDTEGLIGRLDATLTTVEGLVRFEGHLLNWYDTETLAPLQPA
jgi:cyclic beta-1,2-glucan synthetase